MADGIRSYSLGGFSALAIILIVVLVIILIPLLVLGLIGAAFTRLGFSWIEALAVILLILLGSAVNIPLWKIRREMIRVEQPGGWSGGGEEPWETVVALNLGGAVIPVVIVAYLLYAAARSAEFPSNGLVLAGAAILIVAAITAVSTRSDRASGVHAPLLIPGLCALLCGYFLAGGTGTAAMVIAAAGGVCGTLLGSGLIQLAKARDLSVPMVSIGGAGIFGSVVICCILPALVA